MGLTIIVTNIEVNAEIDDSEFAIEPPADYEVRRAASTPGRLESIELDLIEGFRVWTTLSDGQFPSVFSIDAAGDLGLLGRITSVERDGGAIPGIEFGVPDTTWTPPGEAGRLTPQEQTAAITQLGRFFILVSSMNGSIGYKCQMGDDWGYVGGHATLGDAEAPVFWYKRTRAAVTRVIFADLSIRDIEMEFSPDDSPEQRSEQNPKVQDQYLESALLSSLRAWTKLSGGPFPSSFTLGAIKDLDPNARIVFDQTGGSFSVGASLPNDWTPPGARDESLTDQERAELNAQTLPLLETVIDGFYGLFSMPGDSNWRYVGKGVNLGDVQTPIFWYNPVGSEEYRVLFGDLRFESMAEADLPAVESAKP